MSRSSASESDPLRSRLSVLTRPGPALLIVTAAALLARFWALGWRIFHQDEGRVAGWILHYMRTGSWEYNAIIHGPFIPRVNGLLFSWFGPSDFLARFPVAVVGGLLPLVAWLLRDRLRDSEVVALGVVLAANPILLYYSRFMRNDVLLAGFMLFAVAFAVRAVDADRPELVVASLFCFGLGFTTKENALVYPIAWAGALALTLDARLVLSVARGGDWVATLADLLPDPRDRRTRRFGAAGLVGVLVAVAIYFIFYVPLPLESPSAALESATTGVYDELQTWLSGDLQSHAYPPYFVYFGKLLAYTSLPLTAFAAVGFVVDRYAGVTARDVVSFHFFWGLFSLFGYPLIVDISGAAWNGVHIVAPLAVPAAVGLALVWRMGRNAFHADDNAGAVAAAVLLLLAAGTTGAVAADTSYLRPQSPDTGPYGEKGIMIQYAQPAGEMQPALRGISRSAPENEGTDVLYYGELFDSKGYGETWAAGGNPPPGWFDRLPLPWYTGRMDAETNSTPEASVACETNAPVVIALERYAHGSPNHAAEEIDDCLRDAGYREVVYQQYQSSRPLHFFLAPGVAPDVEGINASDDSPPA